MYTGRPPTHARHDWHASTQGIADWTVFIIIHTCRTDPTGNLGVWTSPCFQDVELRVSSPWLAEMIRRNAVRCWLRPACQPMTSASTSSSFSTMVHDGLGSRNAYTVEEAGRKMEVIASRRGGHCSWD